MKDLNQTASSIMLFLTSHTKAYIELFVILSLPRMKFILKFIFKIVLFYLVIIEYKNDKNQKLIKFASFTFIFHVHRSLDSIEPLREAICSLVFRELSTAF